jgi:hypothetical protein
VSYDRFMGLMWGVLAGVCFGLSALQPKFFIIGALPILGACLLQGGEK